MGKRNEVMKKENGKKLNVVMKKIVGKLGNLNLYLKIFLLALLLTTFLLSFLYVAADGLQQGVREAFYHGIFIGFFMTIWLGGYHIVSTRGLGIKSSQILPRQKRNVSVKGTMPDVFKKCIQAINQFGARIDKQDADSGIIEAVTKTTIGSYGEVVSISLSSVGGETVAVEIASSPRIRTALVDGGKGLRNVRQLEALIQTNDEKS